MRQSRFMLRILTGVLCLGAAVLAQDDYDRLIDEAIELERTRRPGDGPDMPLARSYLKLAQAVDAAPQRWEAFALRGVNRCSMTVVWRSLLREYLLEERTAGTPEKELKLREQRGQKRLDEFVEQARQNFQVMQRRMEARNEVDPHRIRFASAAIKYAQAEYLKDRSGGQGAIGEFRELIQGGWKEDLCSEFIARCYIELGIVAVAQERYGQAQEYWDTALRWARTPATREITLSNKAAAFDLDNEYGFAEHILRSQIEQQPDRPVHWKNLGLMLGQQNKLRAALQAYQRSRERCLPVVAPLHGNAWLKAAMIHGKLLEEDGDLHLAWKLFLEYRLMLGDNYNFCLNFGDFARHMRQYEMAWVFLGRARDLRPYCAMPHQLILSTALRLSGSREEVKERVKAAREALRKVLRGFRSRESTRLTRLCGGLRERSLDSRTGADAELLDPDPLAGLTPGRPPDWILEAARGRESFRPYDPALDATTLRQDAGGPAGDEKWGARLVLILSLLGLLTLGGAILIVKRRR